MAHHLHARRKNPNVELGGPHHASEDLDRSLNSQSTTFGFTLPGTIGTINTSTNTNTTTMSNSTDSSKRLRSNMPRELRVAFSAIAGFVAIALLLSGLILHTQHRRKIHVVLQHPWEHGKAVFRGSRHGFQHHFYSGSPRFVTVVMPSVVNPDGRTNRLTAIQETWGPEARAVMVVHNQTELPGAQHAVISAQSAPEDSYSYPQLLLLPEHIEVEHGLPRLYHTIRTVYEKINPDFAFFVNDHTFVIAEHLCKFLSHMDPDDDLYAGHALKHQDSMLNSGAAGYVLSRSSMRKIMTLWDRHDPACWHDPSSATSWVQGNPGISTLQCLDHLHIYATDTRARNRWHRFHAFPLTRVVSGKVDEWYIHKHDVPSLGGSYKELPVGEDCCSMDTISFHYVEAKETVAMFKARQFLLRNPGIPDVDLAYRLEGLWPSNRQETGFYSTVLPDKNEEPENWKALLKVLRKISMKENQRYC